MLGIELLFIPVSEPWRNGSVEALNKTYERVFFNPQRFDNLCHLGEECSVFESTYCERRPHTSLNIMDHGSKIPSHVHFKKNLRMLDASFASNDFKFGNRYKFPLEQGVISYIRFIRSNCKLSIFTESFDLPKNLMYRYVKASINVQDEVLSIYNNGNIITEFPYKLMKNV